MKRRFITLTLCFVIPLILSSCASVNEQTTQPASKPAPHEGGIVGTGKRPGCPQKDSQGKCVEQRP